MVSQQIYYNHYISLLAVTFTCNYDYQKICTMGADCTIVQLNITYCPNFHCSNECTTFVSSTSDSQDEPICDARVLYNLSRHHQGYDALAPVGHENVERDRKQISPYHEPSGRGYGGTQSGNYDHIYRHMDDSGRHDKLQHDW